MQFVHYLKHSKLVKTAGKIAAGPLTSTTSYYTQGYGQCYVMGVHKNADMCRDEYTA